MGNNHGSKIIKQQPGRILIFLNKSSYHPDDILQGSIQLTTDKNWDNVHQDVGKEQPVIIIKLICQESLKVKLKQEDLQQFEYSILRIPITQDHKKKGVYTWNFQLQLNKRNTPKLFQERNGHSQFIPENFHPNQEGISISRLYYLEAQTEFKCRQIADLYTMNVVKLTNDIAKVSQQIGWPNRLAFPIQFSNYSCCLQNMGSSSIEFNFTNRVIPQGGKLNFSVKFDNSLSKLKLVSFKIKLFQNICFMKSGELKTKEYATREYVNQDNIIASRKQEHKQLQFNIPGNLPMSFTGVTMSCGYQLKFECKFHNNFLQNYICEENVGILVQ